MDTTQQGMGVSTKIATAVSVLLALVMVSPIAGAFGGYPAPLSTTYGGRAYGLGVEVPIWGGTYYADTGQLPGSGGALFTDTTDIGSNVGSLTSLITYTRGFNDGARSEAGTSDLSLVLGGIDVGASFVYAGAAAACDGVSGASEVFDLTIGGVSYGVSGAPNQVIYYVPGVLTLIANEQNVNGGSITVNALHAITPAADVTVAHAASSIDCGGILSYGGTVGTAGTIGTRGTAPRPQPWHIPPHDFMTGGGFFFANGDDTCNGVPFSGDRINFGFNAGPRPGGWPTVKGHLNLIDHGPNCEHHIQGTDVTDYFQYPPDDVQHCRRWGGPAELDHVSGYHFAVVTCDYGEPGRDDRFAINVWLGNDATVENNAPVYHADNYDGTPAPEGGNLNGGNIQLHAFG